MKILLYLLFLTFKYAYSRRAFINVHKNNIINSKLSTNSPYKNILYQNYPKAPISQAITKKQIIDEVSIETKENKKTVEKIMNGIFDNIYKHLENNEKIYIHKFGVYYNVFRKKRRMKNMITKEDIIVESSHMPHFKFSKIFKDLIKVNIKTKNKSASDDETVLDEENLEESDLDEDDLDEENLDEDDLDGDLDEDDLEGNLNKKNIVGNLKENVNEKLIY